MLAYSWSLYVVVAHSLMRCLTNRTQRTKMAANDGGSQVDILSLPPADLDKIRKSMAADVEVLTSNFGTLKVHHQFV